MSNQTTIQFHTWKPEPLIRGTFGILSTCLTTMTFCIWTAVHLNIPEYKKESQQFWRKIRWLIIALFAPEYVALCAFWQRKAADEIGVTARRAFNQPDPPSWRQRWQSMLGSLLQVPTKLWHFLCKTPRSMLDLARFLRRTGAEIDKESPSTQDKLQDDDEAKSSHQQRFPWTSTHSVYAVMGGFALDTHGEQNNFLPRNRRRIILTFQGLQFLLEHKPSLIPDISKTTIKDKSKANWFVKAFVSLQSVWFCTQCFTRWGQRLSVSLLEIDTLAHALCALLIYALWWNKPLDVEEPTLIRGHESHPISAYMCLCSRIRNAVYSADKQYAFRYGRLKIVREPKDLEPSRFASELVKERGWNGKLPNKPPNTDGTLVLRPGECTHGFQYLRGPKDSNEILKLQPVDITCWQLASEAVDTQPDLTVKNYSPFLTTGVSLVIDRISNSMLNPSMSGRYGRLYNVKIYSLTLLFAGFFYGGIHLIAWDHVFRTSTEALLWKISGLAIIACGALYTLIDFVYHRGFAKYAYVPMLYDAVIIGGGIFYALCRVFIIVESFLDVFHLPDSAFQMPTWSQYFWHAG